MGWIMDFCRQRFFGAAAWCCSHAWVAAYARGATANFRGQLNVIDHRYYINCPLPGDGFDARTGFCLADHRFGQCNDGFALCSACLDASGSTDLWRLSSFAHESWNGALDLDDTDLSAAPASPNRVFGWPCGGALDGGSWRDRAFCGS